MSEIIVGKERQKQLDQICFKLKCESDLTLEEVTILFYEIECDNSALYGILCILHELIEKNNQEELEKIYEQLKHYEIAFLNIIDI
jgi:hypothetical protein